jgi:hypothetical protein
VLTRVRADQVAALEKRTTAMGLESGEETEWCLAEIERKRDEMAFALRVLDILSPPSVSSGGSAIITSHDAKSKDKKALHPHSPVNACVRVRVRVCVCRVCNSWRLESHKT